MMPEELLAIAVTRAQDPHFPIVLPRGAKRSDHKPARTPVQVGYAPLLKNQTTITLGPSRSEHMAEWSATRTVGVKGFEETFVRRFVAVGDGRRREHVEVHAERRGERGEDVVDEAQAGARVQPAPRSDGLRPRRTRL